MWDIVKSQRLTEYNFQDSRISTLAETQHLTKTQLTTNPERDLPKNLTKQKHPEFMTQP